MEINEIENEKTKEKIEETGSLKRSVKFSVDKLSVDELKRKEREKLNDQNKKKCGTLIPNLEK